MAQPYLSVVVTARNDNHGGDLLARMQTFVNALVAQCERHRIDAELVVVEWNPPDDRPRLVDELDWPASDRCDVRVIEVPAELHARLEHAARLPLFQMIAKNVGIRRSRGRFVLATNVDVIFSDELMASLRPGRLVARQIYRVDRHDVDIAPDPALGLTELLQACRRHVVRVCAREGTHDLRSGAYYAIYDRLPPWLRLGRLLWWAFVVRFRTVLGHMVAFTKQTLAHAALTARYRGRQAGAKTRLALAAVLAFGLRALAAPDKRRLPRRAVRLLLRLAVAADRAESPPEPKRDHRPARNGVHRLGAAIAARRGAFRRAALAFAALREAELARVRLHTNASGDFTLLARESWLRTRGYPELEMFSMHIDGLFLYQAHYNGLREHVLPGPLFHIEHTAGFKPDPQEVESLNSRLERAAIPQISIEQFIEWIRTMYRTHQPIEFNGPDWGLAGIELHELRPASVRTGAVA